MLIPAGNNICSGKPPILINQKYFSQFSLCNQMKLKVIVDGLERVIGYFSAV